MSSALTCLFAGNSGSRVYYLDQGNNVRELAWNGSGWDSNPLAPGQPANPGAPLTCVYTGGFGLPLFSDVYYQDVGNNIRRLFWTGNGWDDKNVLAPAKPGGPLACLDTGGRASRVYYLDQGNNIREVGWDGRGFLKISDPLAPAKQRRVPRLLPGPRE